jgi:hypothetical protein
MNPAIITLDDLKTVTGCQRLNEVEKQLRKNGVRFLYGKTGIYTTIDALNAAMGLQSAQLPATDAEIELL